MKQCSELLLDIHQMKQLYESRCGSILKKFGLKKVELDVLLFLANNAPRDTARDIAELRGLAKSNVSWAIERLSAKGYLTVKSNRTDRRIHHLCLTDAASPVIEEGRAMQEAYLVTLFGGLTPQEREILERIGRCVRTNVKEAIQHVG